MANCQVSEDHSVALPSSPALFNHSVVLVVDAKYKLAVLDAVGHEHHGAIEQDQ